MRILLIGGSNTGMRSGWGRQFERLAARHQVDNGFLDAVGSSFGVVRLRTYLLEQKQLPELILFEYALNDYLLTRVGYADINLAIDSVIDVLHFCAEFGIRLQFICLDTLRVVKRAWATDFNFVKYQYGRLAKAYGLHPCIGPQAAIGRRLTSDCFLDDFHLNAAVAEALAGFILNAIDTDPPPVPVAPGACDRSLTFFTAHDADFSGDAGLVPVSTRVFSGDFLQMNRGSSSDWRGNGQLVAIIQNVDPLSGIYSIGSNGRRLRKNAFSTCLTVLQNPIVMSYLKHRIVVRGSLHLSMRDGQADLARLKADPTQEEDVPVAPHDDQIVRIGGLILWQPRRSRVRRMAVSALATCVESVLDVLYRISDAIGRRRRVDRPAGS